MVDALDNTTCYAYDARGRKTAEWGTAIQPACFGYDEADRLVSLTTFRAGTETISSDPSERTDGDTTTWEYHDATGLEVRKTYADGSQVNKTYDSFNRLTTETDARGIVKMHAYELKRSLLLRTTYSDGTTPREFAYDHLGQLTQVSDDAGVRTIRYNVYGEVETDSLLADDVTHVISEQRDEFGRSVGYTYAKDGVTQQTVTTGYAEDGRIASAGFLHSGSLKNFEYSYLPGSNLLEKLTMPNDMTLTQSYEAQRDLLTGMEYKRGDTLVTQRSYAYDALGRPLTRDTQYPLKDIAHSNSFVHNSRSELVHAQLDDTMYGYDYDNIGNRRMAVEGMESSIYEANELNQYTSIVDGADTFEPTFDRTGNQTLVKTNTGTWRITYNAEKRAEEFACIENDTVIKRAYDTMGRRVTKKVTTNGEVTLYQRYIYRGYLQIATCDLTRSTSPNMWHILWDPTQPTATRPLAIRKDGVWYAYGWDLTKNICEIYGQTGYIRTLYTYTPYGAVTADGDVTQPIQWSSEFYDMETGLIYYNFRHYNPINGRFIGRDPIENYNLYTYCFNSPILLEDILGLSSNLESRDNLTPLSGIGIGIEINQHRLIKIDGENFFASFSNPPDGHANPTGHYYIYKADNPKRQYRLDYHELSGSNGEKVWHSNVNRVGSFKFFKNIENHTTKGATTLGKIVAVFKYAGKALFVVGGAVSLVEVYRAKDKMREAIKQVAGWSGAVAGAGMGGKIGASAGSLFGPIGTIIGGAAGAIVGGLAGWYVSETIVTQVYDYYMYPIEKEEYLIC